MSRIVITNRVHGQVLETLAPHGEIVANTSARPWSAEEVARAAGDAEAIMTFMPDSIGAAELSAMPRLRIVACALKGFDNFDVEACTRAGVWITIVPDLLTVPTAELTIGLTIALARHVPAGDAHVRSGSFRGWRPTLYGTGLAGSRVGVLGMGAVGRAVAARLGGFEATVTYWDRTRLTAERERDLGVLWQERDALLGESDFVISALPLTPETLHLLDASAIARMKPGALLVNPSRGSVVDEGAVADALERGHVAGYAADVFEMEDWARPDRPGAVEPRLLAMPDRTLFTPHLGSAVTSVRLAIEMEAARSIIDVLEGRAPSGALNRPAAMARQARC